MKFDAIQYIIIIMIGKSYHNITIILHITTYSNSMKYRMVKNFGSKKLWRIWQIEINSPIFLKKQVSKGWSRNCAVSKHAMTTVVVSPTISIDNILSILIATVCQNSVIALTIFPAWRCDDKSLRNNFRNNM